MSDLIARMKLESQDFDNKLKSATSNLQHMEREVRRTGASFEYADKEETAFLHSLGSMETKALDAKGKIKELSNSYKELAMMYQRMTKEEKASQPGKALAASLQQLKGRLNDTKASFESVSKEIGEGGGGLGAAFQTLGNKIGIPMDLFTKFGPAIAAVSAAVKVAKDAFMNMESGIDEWGRTVEGGKAAYSSFLDTLNGGNWSGFFTNLQSAISGARELYDAMDRLGSIKANNAAAIAKEQATIQDLRLRQERGEKVAEELAAAEERLRNLQSQSVEQGKKAGELQMYNTIRDRANATKLDRKDKTTVDDAAINAAVQEILASGQDAMDKYAQIVKDTLKKVDVEHYDYYKGEKYYTQDWSKLTDQEKQAYKLALAITEGETKLQQGIEIYSKAVQEGAASAREARKTETAIKKETTKANTGSGFKLADPHGMPEVGSLADLEAQAAMVRSSMSGAINADEYKEMEDHLNEILAKIKEIKGEKEVTFTPGSLNDLNQQLKDAQAVLANLAPGTEEWAAALKDVQDKQKAVNDLQDSMKQKTDETAASTTKLVTEWDKMKGGVEAFGTLTSAMSSIKSVGEDLTSVFSGEKDALESVFTVMQSGLTIMETFISLTEMMNSLKSLGIGLTKAKTAADAEETTAAVTGATTQAAAQGTVAAANMTTAGTAAAASSAEAGEAVAGIPIVGPILAVAAIAAVLAATFAAMSKAKSAGKFASGGIVPGNSFSGDNQWAQVNAGELILSKSQQSSIAGQLSNSNPMGNLQLSTEVSGTDLRIVLNNDNRSRGGSRGYYSNIH